MHSAFKSPFISHLLLIKLLYQDQLCIKRVIRQHIDSLDKFWIFKTGTVPLWRNPYGGATQVKSPLNVPQFSKVNGAMFKFTRIIIFIVETVFLHSIIGR